MKERPILFKGPMVRAILDGRKTQTRRVVKLNLSGRAELYGMQWHVDDPNVFNACPYGIPGDRLWVREKWASVWFVTDCETGYADDWGNVVPTPKTKEEAKLKNGWPLTYATDRQERDGSAEERGFSWIPSIHMPRWASRIDLEITRVWVERLQDISDLEARQEGVMPLLPNSVVGCKRKFIDLWKSINGPGSWDANPWVWVIEFKQVGAHAS